MHYPVHHQQLVEDCVELVCQKGCRSVRLIIAALERGEDVPEARGLDEEDRRGLLEELQSIMAAYGDTCR
jgi:hypothetical protein